jgi:MFS family permease
MDHDQPLWLTIFTGSFQIFSVFFCGLVVGPLVDKGYFRVCFHGGSIMLLVSLVLTSFCRAWFQLFLVQGVATGISMGMVFSTCVINITTYFSTQLGIVSGLAAAGASIGTTSQ